MICFCKSVLKENYVSDNVLVISFCFYSLLLLLYVIISFITQYSSLCQVHNYVHGMVTFISRGNAIWQLAVEVHASLASSAHPPLFDSFQSSADQ